MADAPCITRPGATEPTYFTHSPVTAVFSKFITALGVAIELERDIEFASCTDPAFDHWLRQAELAWENTTTQCHRVLDAPAIRPSDVPLQNMARLLDFALGSESPEEFRCVEMVRAGHPDRYEWRGGDPVARRVRTMLARAHTQFDDIGGLDMIESFGSTYDFQEQSILEPGLLPLA